MHNVDVKSIGYARVSTSGQTLQAQLDQLASMPCNRVFQETVSGAKTDRPELRKALAALNKGDVLIITRLDRLARSTRDLENIVHDIREKGAALRSLADAWLDTATPTGQLVLTVLGGIAQFERSLIRDRTSEGRARAKQAGRRLGRPPKLTPHQCGEARRLQAEGQDNAEIARLLGVHRSTISRLR